jgi:hypothetical protein
MSRPDWHGLVGVTRSLHAAICRAHLCVPKTLNPTIAVMKSAQDGA